MGVTPSKDHRLVGLISDTHGLLRPEAVVALEDCELIIHAGDIGGLEILEALGRVAPVVAVRGNIDRGARARGLPKSEAVEVGGVSLYVLHDLTELDLDPRAAGFKAVISGHSHQPRIEERDGVMFLNPGSAGPRRFTLPVTVARLCIHNGMLDAKIVGLNVEATPRHR